ncbi:IS110 family transposase [Leekyejoonella antrihumi]|uniref:IS110 family transposase n=1 Tax=Leekyejoonella antrihumi TaxID=1660198 RepID=UPI001C961CC0|nr:transposase [Leekyejoonella antrihumi]
MFDRVAGLDIGKASLTVCVRTPGARRGRHAETRTFKTTLGSLRLMRDWLLEQGVGIAAMESTSTYWKAPFYCLEEVMQVWLLNAAHMKAVPGRKSDVRDAEWIAQLLEHGLLAPSFVPPPPVRRLRMLTRYRVQLLGDRTRESVRLELMLEDVLLTELRGRVVEVCRQAAAFVVTVRSCDWSSGCAAGFVVVGRTPVWVARGDGRGVRAVSAC